MSGKQNCTEEDGEVEEGVCACWNHSKSMLCVQLHHLHVVSVVKYAAIRLLPPSGIGDGFHVKSESWSALSN